jgi:enoyl-CoA hydratase/carnithine racemase
MTGTTTTTTEARMDYETILYETKGNVAYITWNRPEKLNAMSQQLKQEFCDAMLRANGDPAIRVLVFKGAGRAFSAGAELNAYRPRQWPGGLPEGMDAGEYLVNAFDGVHLMFRYAQIMAEIKKPIIAQVHSWCLGEASFAAVMADLTIASDDAVFGAPEIREAQPAMPGWMFAIGWKNASRYCLTGDHFDAREALRMGLVNEVVPRDALAARVAELSRRLGLISPEAMQLNKAMIRQGMNAMGWRSAQDNFINLNALLLGSAREEPLRRLESAGAEKGLRGFLAERDGPFQPEPMGPRSKKV